MFLPAYRIYSAIFNKQTVKLNFSQLYPIE